MVRNILINEHITVIPGQLLTTPSTVSGNKEQYGILSSIHNNVVNNTQLSSRRTVGNRTNYRVNGTFTIQKHKLGYADTNRYTMALSGDKVLLNWNA